MCEFEGLQPGFDEQAHIVRKKTSGFLNLDWRWLQQIDIAESTNENLLSDSSDAGTGVERWVVARDVVLGVENHLSRRVYVDRVDTLVATEHTVNRCWLLVPVLYDFATRLKSPLNLLLPTLFELVLVLIHWALDDLIHNVSWAQSHLLRVKSLRWVHVLYLLQRLGKDFIGL